MLVHCFQTLQEKRPSSNLKEVFLQMFLNRKKVVLE